jgi:adenine specific DNA methylase Mod
VWDGKYGSDGAKTRPVRVALPFQDVETVNESAQERSPMLDLFARNEPREWRNRLIWGDKKYVLPSLLPEFAGKVNLVYIDPPFATGADFSYTARIPDDPTTEGDQSVNFVKQPSIIEQKAYRDTWGRGLDSYLQWFYETTALLYELLAVDGSCYVHLDWHVSHHAKAVLDEFFGADNFLNEIIWQRTNAHNIKPNYYLRIHDVILFYRKSERYKWNGQFTQYSAQQLGRYEVDEEGRYYTGQDLTMTSNVSGPRDVSSRKRTAPRAWTATRST